MDSALKQEQYDEFTLVSEHDLVWITVGNISVYLRRTDEGVAIDLYPVGQEMHDSLAGTWALFSEAENSIEDELGSGNQR